MDGWDGMGYMDVYGCFHMGVTLQKITHHLGTSLFCKISLPPSERRTHAHRTSEWLWKHVKSPRVTWGVSTNVQVVHGISPYWLTLKTKEHFNLTLNPPKFFDVTNDSDLFVCYFLLVCLHLENFAYMIILNFH